MDFNERWSTPIFLTSSLKSGISCWFFLVTMNWRSIMGFLSPRAFLSRARALTRSTTFSKTAPTRWAS